MDTWNQVYHARRDGTLKQVASGFDMPGGRFEIRKRIVVTRTPSPKMLGSRVQRIAMLG